MAAKQPQPTTVLLVRHGRTPTTGSVLPGRARGLHLSETGASQASHAARRIAGLPAVAAVYASPLERAQETARPIAKELGLRVRTAKGLNECDFGKWTGESLAKLAKLPEWQTVQRYPGAFRFPRGESFAQMQSRITDTLAELVADHRGETIVAVSHADPIKAAVAAAAGVHIDLFQRIGISPCSITAIVYSPTGPFVMCVNSLGDDLTALAPS